MESQQPKRIGRLRPRSDLIPYPVFLTHYLDQYLGGRSGLVFALASPAFHPRYLSRFGIATTRSGL